MHQTTISFHEAKQVVAQQKQQTLAAKVRRLRILQEFKSSLCDMFDTQDFMYYVEETGLKLTTLLRFAKYNPPMVERVFAKAPGTDRYEPLNVRTGLLAECSFQATKSRPHLLEHLRRLNPGWQFIAAPCAWSANR